MIPRAAGAQEEYWAPSQFLTRRVMADGYEERVLAITAIVCEGIAMNEAALEGDFDEVRFRAISIASAAQDEGLKEVAQVADRLIAILGPAGSLLESGYGSYMADLAERLDAVALRLTK